MGGILVLAGEGLPPDAFLSEKWFEAVNAVTRRVRRRRDSVWIYEDLDSPWAQRRVEALTAEHPEFGQSRLVLTDFVADASGVGGALPGSAVASFMVTRDDALGGAVHQQGGRMSLVPDGIEAAPVVFDVRSSEWPGQRFLVFEEEACPGRLNYFNPGAITAYLDETHGRYFQNVKRYFGNTLGLCFVGGAHFSPEAGSLPWDDELPTLFRETRGYSLLHNLPALFFDTPGCEAVRYDFWTLIAEMFREGMASAFKDWCTERRIPCSGHYLDPESVAKATCSLGSLVPLYEYQDFPGVNIAEVDVYSRPKAQEAYLHRVVAIKEAVSVKRQLSKGGVVNESVAAGRRGQSLDSLRRIAQFQMALGLDFVTHHAGRASLRGDRKHDSPPIVGAPQPNWGHMKKHLDALSRLSWVLSQGRSVCEVLVLHPCASVQAGYRHPRRSEEEAAAWSISEVSMSYQSVERHFALLSSALLDAQIDFDYGDEIILARHGLAGRRHLEVGAMEYRIVLLPPMTNMRESTLHLLQDFAMGGGIVLALGTTASLVDGRPSGAVRRFVEEYAERIVEGIDLFDYTEAVRRLTNLGGRVAVISDEDGRSVPSLKVQRRSWEDIDILYVTHTGEGPVEASISFQTGPGRHVEVWDPASGGMTRLCEGDAEAPVRIPMKWHGGQARIFATLAGEDKNVPAWRSSGEELRRISPTWYGTRMGPNVFPLAECRIVGDERPGAWSSIASARSVLEGRIEKAGRPVPFRMEWRFWVSEARAVTDPCSVGLELGPDSTAALNGEELVTEGAGWIVDPAILNVPLLKVRPGENVLEVWRLCATVADVQAPWVLGPFQLAGSEAEGWTLECEEQRLAVGEWEALGMPFFAGPVVYRSAIEGHELRAPDRAVLHVPGLMGTAEVRINGKAVDQLLWPPYEVDITEFWARGKLELEIEVAGSLRNLFEAGRSRLHEGGAVERERAGLVKPPEIVILSPATKVEVTK